jgi:hypothetical protein
VHICSSNRGELDRLTIENFQQRRNVHLNRLFRVRHSRRKLILVVPEGLSGEVRAYYEKMLNLNAVPDLHKKVTFLEVPFQAFPAHMSLYSVLRYSPQSAARLKTLCKGWPCYLVPSEPSNELVLLSDCLEMPLLMGEPQACYLLGLKSESKRLFKEAGLPLTVGSI